MATSLSTAQGARGLGNIYGEGGHSGYSGPRAAYDDNTPAGVDPEGLWRQSNSDRFRRHGTTQAERAGAVPGYTPGYGRSSNRNTAGGTGSLTPRAEWDAQFQQRLTPAAQGDHVGYLWPASSGGATSPENPGIGEPRPAPTIPVLPPAATPPTSPGLMANAGRYQDQSATVIPSGTAHPIVQAGGETRGDNAVRQVIGLPPGQTASATFIPGQNSSQQNLNRSTDPSTTGLRGQSAPPSPIKKLTRAPADPYAS